MPKTRNIIIFSIIIALALFLVYFFFIRSSAPQTSLVSANPTSPGAAPLSDANALTENASTSSGTPIDTSSFLTLLLNVQTIKLDDSIFSDTAFNSLHDSSITLTPDPNPGRPNPFAQFGNDSVPAPSSTGTITGTITNSSGTASVIGAAATP